MTSITYAMLYLGNLRDMDPNERNATPEHHAAVMNGRVFGSGADPLFAGSIPVTLNDRNGDGTVAFDHGGSSRDSVTYCLNGVDHAQRPDTGFIVMNASVVQAIGGGATRTLTNVPLRLFQAANGDTFMMPPLAHDQLAGEGELARHPILSVSIPSSARYNTGPFNGLGTDRVILPFRDGFVDGTDGDDLIGAGYVDGAGDRTDAGDAILPGHGGHQDVIRAGAGNDTVYGGAGADSILGGAGNDLLYGHAQNGADDGANDTLDGGEGDDTAHGGAGDDSLLGGGGNDMLIGGQGDDRLFGGEGDDTLMGDDRQDSGGGGADLLDGGAGRDLLMGGAGDDTLLGGDGSDTLLGGDGNDLIAGGTSTIPGGTDDMAPDTLTGGQGFDRFVAGHGDIITDFGTAAGAVLNDGNQANNDFVDLSAHYNAANLAIINAARSAAGHKPYGNTLAWLRADQADGVLDDIRPANGFDRSFTLRLHNNGRPVAAQQLTTDNTNVNCFAADAMILTPDGPVAAGLLAQGTMVLTRDAGPRPIRWIGRRRLEATDLDAAPNLRPIRIRRGALGRDVPSADLVVSPQHRLLVRSGIARSMFGTTEVLVAARQLLTVEGIEIAADLEAVTYVHFLLDGHQIVIANGAETESLYTGAEALKAVGAAACEEIWTLFPDLRGNPQPPSARRLVPGRQARELALRHRRDRQPLVA